MAISMDGAAISEGSKVKLSNTATLLSAVAATGAGDTLQIAHVDELTVQASGTFVGTIQLEGSVDGSSWGQIGSDITATGVLLSSQNIYKFIRGNVTAYTSGTITLKAIVGIKPQYL